MSSIPTAPLLAVALFSVAACSGSNTSRPAPVPASNSLALASDGSVQAARADVSRASNGQILLTMTEGPMAGMSMQCNDATLGACLVVGGPAGTSGSGTLLERFSGQYAFVGNFSVLQVEDGALASPSLLVHAANPDWSSTAMTMPQGRVDYTGQFSAGAGLTGGPSGMISGTTTLIADFNAGVLAGQMSGGFEDGTAVSASFNNVTINASNGQFTTTDNSVILFQGSIADGLIDGAFYGPGAEEAAGIFQFGNEHGGMSGIFIACQGADASCITP